MPVEYLLRACITASSNVFIDNFYKYCTERYDGRIHYPQATPLAWHGREDAGAHVRQLTWPGRKPRLIHNCGGKLLGQPSKSPADPWPEAVVQKLPNRAGRVAGMLICPALPPPP